MKQSAQTPNQTKTRRGLARRGLMLSVLALLTFGLWNGAGCLPNPTVFQIDSLQPCSGNLGAGVAIAAGSLDVSVRPGYILQFGLLNMLAKSSDIAQFKPETNFIQVTEGKIWFEYPPTFSLNGGGAALYPESAPKIVKMFFRISPTIEADFSGLQQQGGAGSSGVTVTPSFLRMNILPVETATLWSSAAELKAAPGEFQAIAHVSFTGSTLTGSILSTQEITFPISICSGCLDPQKNQLCQSQGGTAGGSNCAGQDGECFPDLTQNP